MRQKAATNKGSEVDCEPNEVFVLSSGEMACVFAQNCIKRLDSLNNPVTTFYKSLEIWKKQPN